MTTRRRWPRSVRARTTLAATLVVAIALAIAAGGLVWLVRDRLVAAQRDTAVLRATDIAGLAAGGQLPASLSFPGEDSGVAQVVDGSGVVVAATPNLAGELPIANDVPPVGRTRTRIRSGLPIGDNSRFVIVSQGANSPTGKVTVYTAASLEAADQTLLALTIALAFGYPILLIIVAVSGWAAIGRALRPVEAIRAEVADIGERDLHRRVPEPGGGDEIDRLADTMNTMLSRLESSAERQRRFVADASHELRSPIASLRAVLEVAAAHPSTSELRTTVGDALTDTYRIEALVVDLLTLARIDDQDEDERSRPIDLVGLCRDILDHRQGPITESGMPDEALVVADELSIRRAVTNLLDNAVRHARTRTTLSLQEAGDHFTLHIDDDGDGVPPIDRERVFERFTRLDSARSRDDGGTGLGLAIVAELAERFGGSVSLSDSPIGGARFTLQIPAAKGPDATVPTAASPSDRPRSEGGGQVASGSPQAERNSLRTDNRGIESSARQRRKPPMSLSRPRKILFTTAAAAGLLAGGAGLANAATTSSTSSANGVTAPATASDNNDSPSYTGSVTVADTGTENANGTDTNEDAQLQGLAKITPDQASAAALAAVPGTASTPVLENENGNVVYGVQVTMPSGSVDVKVDAGNGTVLAQSTDDGNEKESAPDTDSTNDAHETGSAAAK